jgi:hypothetical protein
MAKKTVAAQALNFCPMVNISPSVLHEFFEGFGPGKPLGTSSELVNSEKASS